MSGAVAAFLLFLAGTSGLPTSSEKLARKVTFSNFEERSQQVGLSANGVSADAEIFPYQVLESFLEYKTVKFPASKWVCTQEETADAEDPFMDWTDRYDNNGHKALTQNSDMEAANRQFNRLFRYMVGVNSEHQTIPMTKPVTDLRTVDKEGYTNHELCFWTGSLYATKPLPIPSDNSTYIVERESFMAFVKKFGGYSLSNEDWKDARDSLVRSLSDREDFDSESAATGPFYAVGFDGPAKTSGRHNEVWIPRQADAGPLTPPHGHGKRVLSHAVLESGEGYEMREYKATRWVCTKTREPVKPDLDDLNGWQDEFEANPMDALASAVWENSPFVSMHRKLLRYVFGVNADVTEIEEALPTIVVHEPVAEDYEEYRVGSEGRMEYQSVCMPLGGEYVRSKPPQSIDDDLHIVYKEAHRAYARRFDGFPLSYNDYHKEYLELVKTLKRQAIAVNSPNWSHGIYNSFFKMKGRRNEVFIGL